MKLNFSRMGGLMVGCVAIASICASANALVSQRKRVNPASSVFTAKRVRPSDPSFRWSAAAMLQPIHDKIIGHKIDMDMMGMFVWSETIHHTSSGDSEWFTRSIFWFSPDQIGQVRQMTPAQLAMAETLFKDVNLSKAKNLSITRNGISGSVTNKELGVKAGQLTAMTQKRLANEIAGLNKAMEGLGR